MFIHHFMLAGRWSGLAAAAALSCSPAAQAQPARGIEYSLPQQALARSLREVSVRSGVNVIVPGALVRGRQAPALRGAFEARDAVERLLEGTGLRVEAVGETLVIRTAGEPSGRAPAEAPATSETIRVTGTNIRGSQPASPLIVLGRSEIEASGVSSVEQLMARLPQNSQGGVNRENFRVPGAGADSTEHGAGLNLRGLGQRATLVLVNGRRLAASNTGAFVDVSLIPLSAVERVEILTDGASAIYGSDAVGGVVNFILRRDSGGLEALLLAGSATRGDGDVLQAGLSGGTSWSGGRATIAYEYRAEDEILARDRAFTINLAPGTFLVPRERRHSLFGTVRQVLSPDLTAELTGFFAIRDTDRSYFLTGSPLPADLDAAARSYSLGGRVDYDLGGGWAARLDGGYSATRTDQEQAQVGGQGLINARLTRNATADLSLRLDGSLLDLPAGPLRIVLGADGRREWYRERFRTRTIDLAVPQSRTIAAGFAEVQLPIYSSLNRRPGLERLTLTGAARLEHYEGFGSTFDPRLGIIWSPLEGLTVRGSWGTSFRAPLLSETAGAYSAIYVPAALVFVNPAQAQGTALVFGGSNPEVRPERSRSWTMGAEIAPRAIAGLSLTFNYYSIRFSDRIALPSPIITVVGDPAFESIVTRDPDDDLVARLIGGAQAVLDISGPGFTNGHATPADVTVIVDSRINNTALSRTRGIDAGLSYGLTLGQSRFLFALNANHILSFVDRLRPTSAPVDALDTPYRPLDLRLRARLGWNLAGWSANLFLNHADGYRDNRGGRSLRVGSFTTLDASLAFEVGERGPVRWLRGLRIALSAENLLDAAPPRLLADPGSTTGPGYDPVNASARGRYVSLQLRKAWR